MSNKELLKKVAEDLFDDFSALYPISDEKVEFSERHRERMKKLFGKKNYFAIFYAVPKKILIAVLVFLIVIVLPLSVKAIREPLFSFFSDTFGSITRIFPSEKEKDAWLDPKIEEYYELRYVPDGFELISEERTDVFLSQTYTDGDNTFVYEQKKLGKGSLAVPDGAEIIDRELAVEGKEILYYKYEGKNVFLWNTGIYELKLTADEGIPQKTLEKIAENALSDRAVEEKKVLDQTEDLVPVEPVTYPPETLPIEFPFNLPKGLKILSWKDCSLSEEEFSFRVYVGNDEGKKIALFEIYSPTSNRVTTVLDVEKKVPINDDIVVSWFENVRIYMWADSEYSYEIVFFYDYASHEQVFDMIKELYK